jgi:hypothetical protein
MKAGYKTVLRNGSDSGGCEMFERVIHIQTRAPGDAPYFFAVVAFVEAGALVNDPIAVGALVKISLP